MNSKFEQRKIAKKARLDIKKELYQAYSDTICLKIMNLDKYIKAEKVMAYCPINHEVDTSLLLEDILLEKELILPRTQKDTNSILPLHVDGLKDLQPRAYDILEPGDSCKAVEPSEIDICIVPMVAYDKKGNRLGYGGGYYDRFLKTLPNCTKIGVAFSAQEFEQINTEEHDIQLDIIITEKKIHSF